MKKKSILNTLGERYKALEFNGGYLLYDQKRSGQRSNYLYLGRIYLSSDKTRFVFNDNYYDSVETLVPAMEAYNATLPFNAENYNPIFRKDYKIQCCLHDYLKSLGFTRGFGKEEYVLSDAFGESVCIIKFDVTMDTENGTVQRLIPNTSKWVEAQFVDLDSAMGACNSLISSHCSIVNAQLTRLLNQITKARVNEYYNKYFDVKTLTVYSADAKAKTISLLEEELKLLKGE